MNFSRFLPPWFGALLLAAPSASAQEDPAALEERGRILREGARTGSEVDAAALRRARQWDADAAEAYRREGDEAETRRVAERLLEEAELAGAHGHAFQARSLLVWCALRRGEARTALELADRAEADLPRVPDLTDGEVLRFRLWRFFAALAERAWEDAEAQAEALLTLDWDAGLPVPPDYPAGMLDELGMRRYALLQFADARRVLERALEWSAEHPDSPLPCRVRLNLALCEQELGRYVRAESLLEEALSVARDDAQRARVHLQWASLREEKGETAAAEQDYARALAFAETGGADWLLVELRMSWARMLHHAGRDDEASAVLAPGLARLDRDPDSLTPRERVTVGGWAALLAERAGDAEEACARARAALAVGGAAPDDGLAARLALARLHRAAGDLEAASAERDRALAILEHPVLRARGAATSYLRMRAAAWAAFDADLLQARLAGADADERRRLVASWWRRAQAWKARDVADARAVRAHRDAGAEGLDAPETWARLLPADAVLLDYVFGEDHAYAARLWRGECTWIPLGPRTAVEEAARAYRVLLVDPYAAPDVATLQRAAEDIDRLVWGPAVPVEARRVFVAPTGALEEVPFAALVEPGGEVAEDYRALRFRVRERVVVRVPSPLVWALLAESDAHPRPRRARVVADPAYPDGRWPRLPGTRREAEALATHLPDVESFTGDAATPEALLGDLGDCGLLHVAAHAVPHPYQPQHSRIILAPAGAEESAAAGELRLAVFEEGAALNAELAVLSACDTAQGFRVRGQGTASLARGFLRAGARSVIASVWPVHDAAAADLMECFYAEHLGAERDAATALQRAALGVLEEGGDYGREHVDRGGGRLAAGEREPPPLAGHPYYWAPFVYLGPGLP